MGVVDDRPPPLDLDSKRRTQSPRQRNTGDDDETPAWCVDVLLGSLPGPPRVGTWVDPCAGEGAVVRAVRLWCARRRVPGPSRWLLYELRQKHWTALQSVVDPKRDAARIGDYLQSVHPPAELAIVSPPWDGPVDRMIEACIAQAATVCALLPLSYLATERRLPFLKANPPEVIIMAAWPRWKRRASVPCGWMLWGQGVAPGRFSVRGMP